MFHPSSVKNMVAYCVWMYGMSFDGGNLFSEKSRKDDRFFSLLPIRESKALFRFFRHNYTLGGMGKSIRGRAGVKEEPGIVLTQGFFAKACPRVTIAQNKSMAKASVHSRLLRMELNF